MTAGVHFVRAIRPGKPIRWYIYAWRGGPKIRTAEQPAKPRLTRDDIAAIAAAHAEAEQRPTDTIKGLSAAWQQSPEWKACAPSTRDLWAGALTRIEAKWPDVPLSVFSTPRMTTKIVAWRDTMAATDSSVLYQSARWRSVITAPGSMALTRILSAPNALPSVRVKPMTADLAVP